MSYLYQIQSVQIKRQIEGFGLSRAYRCVLAYHTLPCIIECTPVHYLSYRHSHQYHKIDKSHRPREDLVRCLVLRLALFMYLVWQSSLLDVSLSLVRHNRCNPTTIMWSTCCFSLLNVQLVQCLMLFLSLYRYVSLP